MKSNIGVIHPGMMGICVAATVQYSGNEVYWASEGRSPQSREQAEKYNLSEIAATFREAGMPGEFHAAAEMIYRRIAGFKDAPSTPALEEVLEKLIQTSDKGNE